MSKKKKGLLAHWEPKWSLVKDDMFNDFFKSQRFKPEVDMYETNAEVIVQVNVPGCDKKNVKITVDNNILTVSGEKKEDKEVKRKNFYQKEHRYGSFQRSLTLPSYINTDKVKANCEKGVLKVSFPKMKQIAVKGKEIKID